MIDIQNLEFHYTKKTYAIQNISLHINKGEYVAILGHNGSGKSTLAKLLIGLLEPDKGKIVVDGLELNHENVYDIRKKIGIVFQNPDNQFVGVTVKDDIAFGLENRLVARDEMLDKIDEYARLVNMDKFLSRNPEDLSGGQKQRVAIAGVLAMRPDVIIFDEATSMLDPAGVKEVMNVINSLKGQKTIISITHNLQEAVLANRVIVLMQGKVVLDGTPSEVFQETEILKAAKLSMLDNMLLSQMLDEAKKSQKVDDVLCERIQKLLWEYTFEK